MISSFKSFQVSFWNVMWQWRITMIVYFLQVFLTLTLGMQVYSVLESSIGHSLELNKLLHGYDHTVITDFLKVHGASITPLIGQLRWLLLVWFVLSVFLNAGLLVSAAEPDAPKNQWQFFWQSGARYYGTFLKISVIFLLFALIWTLLILTPVALFFEPSLQYFKSEVFMVWLTVSLLLVYLLGLIVLFLWSVSSRLLRVNSGARLKTCIRKGWKSWWKNKKKLAALMAILVLVQLSSLALYCLLSDIIGSKTAGQILLFFLLQQGFIFFRIQIRQVMYAGIARVIDPI